MINRDVELYAKDASIFKVTPNRAAQIENWQEISDLLNKKTKIAIRGAGTCMSGGSLTENFILDITKVSKILEVTKDYAVVESGILYKDLEKELLKINKFFAPYTSSKHLCAIGGMIGNNASGEKSLRYGSTLKSLLELDVMLSDGEIVKIKEIPIDEAKKYNANLIIKTLYEYVIKNVIPNWEKVLEQKPNTNKNAAGYNVFDIYNPSSQTINLIPLFCGSQGTLGIVTNAKLKIYDILEYNKMLVIPVSNILDLPFIVNSCVNAGATSVECFDSHTYGLSEIHLPQEARLASLCKNKNLIIFAEWTSNSLKEVELQSESAVETLENKNITSHFVINEEERQAYWTIRRMSFKLLMDHAPLGYKAIPIIEDTIVDIKVYEKYLSELLEILKKYDLVYTFAGHISDGSIRLVPLINKNSKNPKEKIFSLAEEVYALVRKYNGSISCDHNDGLARTYILNKQYSEYLLNMFKDIKNILDPNNLLNEGKKVNGNREYSLSKIDLD